MVVWVSGGQRRTTREEELTDVSSMHSLHRSSQVRVLDEKRELVGVFSTADALDQVFSQNLDLILTVPNASPPVCRCGELALVLGNGACGMFRTWIALLVAVRTHQPIFSLTQDDGGRQIPL